MKPLIPGGWQVAEHVVKFLLLFFNSALTALHHCYSWFIYHYCTMFCEVNFSTNLMTKEKKMDHKATAAEKRCENGQQ